MKKLTYLLVFAFLVSCAGTRPLRTPSGQVPSAPNYAEIFKKARELLIVSEGDTLTKGQTQILKKMPESSVVEKLQAEPELLFQTREKLIEELDARGASIADPTKHTRLMPPEGKFGYEDLKLYVSHPYYMGRKLVPKSNLVQVWKEFILSAKKEIIVNVFDFDLEEIAEALVIQAQKGLKVRVGIDKKNVIDVRPEVKKVEQLLLLGGVEVTGVMPVGLNHQKMTAIDWSEMDDARVLFSSGNLTKSCLEPEGDLKGTRPLPKESVPNANHLITLKSWVLANLVHHELTKTLDPSYLLRGRQYPLNGAYQVTGPGVDPNTFEAYPHPSVILTFSPGGGLKNINKNLIAQLIRRETGPIRMLQFAYSAVDVDEALRFRAQQDYQMTGKFDFLSVGDTPFAMREWSRFLIMSGLRREISPDAPQGYFPDPSNPWVMALNEKEMKDLQKKVFVAPRIYGNNTTKVAGKSVKVNAKIHHKILATPRFAIMGTSFNFSAGAESNNEQILVFRDDQLSQAVSGMVKYMVKASPGTVLQEANRRNRYASSVDEGDGEEVERREAEPLEATK